MSRCIHVYPFVARNHGGIPFSGVCLKINSLPSYTQPGQSASSIGRPNNANIIMTEMRHMSKTRAVATETRSTGR